jgi:hypothetical protein
MAFRDLILHNFRRKLFALLLAVLIWFTIYYAGNRHTNFGRLHLPEQTNSLSTP